MYSHVDHRWYKAFLNRIIKILICFCLVYTPFFANAGAAEKWEIVEKVYDPSKNVVDVTAKKITQQAANSGVYKVSVPVSSSVLGGTLKRMLFAGAAVGAITALVEGVGWVIDEGSKVIKKPVSPQDELPFYDYYWIWNGFGSNPSKDEYLKWGSTTAQQACKNIASLYPDYGGKVKSVVVVSDKSVTCYFNDDKTFYQSVSKLPNRWREEGNPPQEQIVTDAELGNEALGKGTQPKSNPQPQPALIADAYSPNNPVSDAPAPQQTNQALENANPQPEKEPEGSSETEKEKDETGAETGKETSKFELPNFCEWAPSVCAFFTVQKQDNKDLKENQKEDIAQNKTFFESVKDFFNWTKENPDIPDDNQPPQITPIDIGQLDTGTFKATAGCPAPIQVPVSFGKGGNVEISYEPICSFASKWSFVAPLIGFLSGAMIIVGVGRKGEDSEL